MAGGDVGAALGGVINLSTSTQSSSLAQIFNAATNAFVRVGSLSGPREAIGAPVIMLANHLALFAGGQDCEPATVGGQSGFLCTAVNTAELYHQDTQTFTLAGSGSGNKMTSIRSGPSLTLLEDTGAAGLDGQVLIVGGSNGSSFLSVTPPASPPVAAAQNTAELYNPATDTFTAINNLIPTPSTCPQGAPNTISAISETTNTVTVTMSTANPTGLTVGKLVNVRNALSTLSGHTLDFNGNFTVATIPDGTHFTYTDATPGLGSGANNDASHVMQATSLTAQCGMVDQGAALIPNSGGKVLLAGGDLIQFLGDATTTSYIFDPSTLAFTQTTGSMTAPRELFPLIPMVDPVTGTLAGKLVAMGGVNANSGACPLSSTVVITTNSDAEVFDPSSQTWSTVSKPSSVISSASESGNVVTVTMTTANPTGLAVGSGVTISGVVAASGVALHFENFGYNGGFVVASIPDSTHFTYNDRFSGLGAGTGGTATANTMGERRTTTPAFFLTGGLAGETILPGGVQVEAGNFTANPLTPNSCVGLTLIKQAALQETDLYDPVSASQGVFTPTGSLAQAREGQVTGIIGSGTDVGELLVAGGACTTTTPSLQSLAIGTAKAASTCNNTGGAGSAENDYSEIYNETTRVWTIGPPPAGGVACSPSASCFTPVNGAAGVVLQ
jgi:hypothetical protein